MLVASVALASALAWWSYGRTTPPLAGWRRVMLPVLRAAALSMILFLILEPIWKTISRSEEAPLLAVLIDDSLSLRLGGDRTPAGLVRGAVAGLPDDDALRLYAFSSETAPTTPGALAFRGARTDISSALSRVESDFAGRNLQGVVLISDGRVTDGRNPIYLAERFPVPVHTAVAGDSLTSRDVRLVRAVTNELAYAGSPLPVRVSVRATGYRGETAQIRLSENGRTLATESVRLPADGEASVDLTFTPTGPGVHRYTVQAVPLPGEATTRNNTETVTVRVVDDRRRVLLLGASPSPDLAAVRSVLEADESLDVTVHTQRSPGTYYEGPLPGSLAGFDLAVLVGWPGRAAPSPDVSRLSAAATSGLPVLFVMTRQTDFGQLASALGNVLPATPEGRAASFVEGTLSVTDDAAEHPVLSGLGVAPQRLESLPPVGVNPARWALQPGARVLAGTRRGAADLGTPILAVRQNGSLRSAAILGAGTWRWRTLPDDLGDLRPAFASLLDGLVRWTTATRDRRPVRVRPDRRTFAERERVTFTGQVYGENLVPVSDARIDITVTGPGGRASKASMRPIGNGRYVADIGPQPPGAYRFSASATVDGATLGTDAGSFAVGETAAEFRAPGADPSLMRQVALRSGGRVVPLDSLGAFVQDLRATGALAPRALTREDEFPVLALPWLLALALGLLTTEWVLRKRAGLV